MVETDGQPERSLTSEQFAILVKLTDNQTDSPLKRSQDILEIITKARPNINTYDLWCFAIHILQSLIAEHPRLTLSLQVLNKFLYQYHYRYQAWKHIPK